MRFVDETTGQSWWEPDDGKPGSYVVAAGRKWQVWSPAPARGTLWLVPCHPRPGEPPVFLLTGEDDVQGHHSDGSPCLKRCRRKHTRNVPAAAA